MTDSQVSMVFELGMIQHRNPCRLKILIDMATEHSLSATGTKTPPTALRATLSALLSTFLFCAGMTAHAIDLWPFDNDEQGVVVWGDGPDQYVKVADQDRFEGYKRPPKNEHPAQLEPQDLAVVLASLRYGSALSGQSAALFAPEIVPQLSVAIADALGRARKREDAVFSVLNQGAVARERLITTGRVFVQGGDLHIIFGVVMQPPGRKKPQPGRRKEPVDDSLTLAAGPGISFRPGPRESRPDWMIIDVPTVVAAYQGPQAPLTAAPSASEGGYPPAGNDAAAVALEKRKMREEMARMRMQTKAHGEGALPSTPGAGAPAAATLPNAGSSTGGAERPSSSAAVAGRSGSGSAAPNSFEKRLATLKELHAKDLITDQEYEAKRQAILDEI